MKEQAIYTVGLANIEKDGKVPKHPNFIVGICYDYEKAMAAAALLSAALRVMGFQAGTTAIVGQGREVTL